MADETDHGFRTLDQFTLHDVESVWSILRGDSVIDWQRVHFESREAAEEFLRVQELRPDDAGDRARMEAIKREAIAYLRRNFEYPIPRSIEQALVEDLLLLASAKGHKQVCACVILKAMHIIHHLQGRELLYMLPLSDAEVFHMVEEKVYRVIGGMLASGLPITEFLGGRKNRDSLYTKLLSKTETIAAQIYDKLRFRIVTRTTEDLLPVLNYLTRRLFPFNYAIPGESKNTLVNPAAVMRRHPHIASIINRPGSNVQPEALTELVDNKFSARTYRVMHFVVDLPVRVRRDVLAAAPQSAWSLGPVVFVLVEFQIVDQEAEQSNETGEASHSKYKERQREAVRDRLRLGSASRERNLTPSKAPRRASKPPPPKR
jgi:uncharacterized protein (TIGR04552 family)